MRKQFALVFYGNYTKDEIDEVARLIQQEMATNAATYPAPPVPIPILTAQIDNYVLIKDKPLYANQSEDLAAARKLINESLHDIAVYVNTVAKGDLVKLGLSGCPVSELVGPVGDLPAPDGVEIKNAGPLSFVFDIKTVLHAAGYLVALTPVANTETDPNLWRIAWSSRHTRTVGGNVDGTKYKFAVCAVGTTDNLNWFLSGTTLFAQ